MDTDGIPRREVVTGRPHTARRSIVSGSAPQAPDEVRAVDRAVLKALMRRQLGAALRTLSALVLLVGLLPLVFQAFPDPARWPAGPLIVWSVLGIVAYPALVLISRWYVLRAERNEKDAVNLVEGA